MQYKRPIPAAAPYQRDRVIRAVAFVDFCRTGFKVQFNLVIVLDQRGDCCVANRHRGRYRCNSATRISQIDRITFVALDQRVIHRFQSKVKGWLGLTVAKERELPRHIRKRARGPRNVRSIKVSHC